MALPTLVAWRELWYFLSKQSYCAQLAALPKKSSFSHKPRFLDVTAASTETLLVVGENFREFQ